MDEHDVQRATGSKLRRRSALVAAIVMALAGAACNPEKQAVPDPQKPPMPKTMQHQ
jgi:hypothetical protein